MGCGTSDSWETKNEKDYGLQDTNSCKISYFCTIMYPNIGTFCNSSLILSWLTQVVVIPCTGCTFPVALPLLCLQLTFVFCMSLYFHNVHYPLEYKQMLPVHHWALPVYMYVLFIECWRVDQAVGFENMQEG